jgi:hypothetical protein
MLVLVIRLHAEQEFLKPVSRKVWPPRVVVPSPELLSPTPEVAPVLIFPHSDRIGCTERRLCIRVARASYTDTPKETRYNYGTDGNDRARVHKHPLPIEEVSATAVAYSRMTG